MKLLILDREAALVATLPAFAHHRQHAGHLDKDHNNLYAWVADLAGVEAFEALIGVVRTGRREDQTLEEVAGQSSVGVEVVVGWVVGLEFACVPLGQFGGVPVLQVLQR